MQCSRIHSNTLQQTATRGSILQYTSVASKCHATESTATLCNTLQHVAAHCNTRLLRLHAMQQNPQQQTATRGSTLQHPSVASKCNAIDSTFVECIPLWGLIHCKGCTTNPNTIGFLNKQVRMKCNAIDSTTVECITL